MYFQDLNESGTDLAIKKYVPLFQVGDVVSVSISALDMQAVAPFNPFIGIPNATNGLQSDRSANTNNRNAPTYLIDANGNIDFPVLGSMKIEGLNSMEAKALFKKKLGIYVKDPIVNIRIENFKVTVLGEVNRPGTFTIPNQKITVIEALGLAGDMRIKGKRKDVIVVRESNGVKKSYIVDMTSKSIFASDAYYLMQNDVVYVQPNKSQIRSSNNNGRTASIIISLTAVLLSGLNLLLR